MAVLESCCAVVDESQGRKQRVANNSVADNVKQCQIERTIAVDTKATDVLLSTEGNRKRLPAGWLKKTRNYYVMEWPLRAS